MIDAEPLPVAPDKRAAMHTPPSSRGSSPGPIGVGAWREPARFAPLSAASAERFMSECQLSGWGDGSRQQVPERQPWCGKGEPPARSEEHTSELQSLMRISYAVFCLKKKTVTHQNIITSIIL